MKKLSTVIISALLAAAMTLSAFAGQWAQDAIGWWYQNNDGSWPVGWAWIDGNNDGIAECYYFNESGYCLMNTTTPDGCIVDPTGAWIVNGIVQTKVVTAQPVPAPATHRQLYGINGVSATPYDGYTIIVNTNTRKYHIPSCNKVKDIKADNLGYASDAALLESQGLSPCKVCH